jgi:hypothetical protein
VPDKKYLFFDRNTPAFHGEYSLKQHPVVLSAKSIFSYRPNNATFSNSLGLLKRPQHSLKKLRNALDEKIRRRGEKYRMYFSGAIKPGMAHCTDRKKYDF